MTPADNTLAETMARAIYANRYGLSVLGLETKTTPEISPRYKQEAEVVIQAFCTYSGLTVEVLEMIRRGEAVVLPTTITNGNIAAKNWHLQKGFVEFILNTPTERREG